MHVTNVTISAKDKINKEVHRDSGKDFRDNRGRKGVITDSETERQTKQQRCNIGRIQIKVLTTLSFFSFKLPSLQVQSFEI